MERIPNSEVYPVFDGDVSQLSAGKSPIRSLLTLADYSALFEQLLARHHNKEQVKIQWAPVNLHSCSDAALEMLGELSARYEAPMHTHLVETAYQKEYAHRRGGGTALDYIDRFGFLGRRLTLGHGVWLNEADLDRIAATGTHTATTAARISDCAAGWHR